MTTIRIQLNPVEGEMLKEVQRVNKRFKHLDEYLILQIQEEYAKISKGKLKGGI